MLLYVLTQEYAMKIHDKEIEKKARAEGEKKGLVRGAVETFQEVGISINETIDRIAAKFDLPLKEASSYVKKFWRS